MKTKYSILFALILLLLIIPIATAQIDTMVNPTIRSASQKIAFVSKRNGNSEIYIINDDGTDLKRLTHSKGDKVKPCWSPNGTKILYFLKKGKQYQLWVMNRDGSGQMRLADDCNEKYSPLWSPDGSKIVFASKKQSKSAVFIVNSDNGTLLRLSQTGEGLSPS